MSSNPGKISSIPTDCLLLIDILWFANGIKFPLESVYSLGGGWIFGKIIKTINKQIKAVATKIVKISFLEILFSLLDSKNHKQYKQADRMAPIQQHIKEISDKL